jgi:hypothetical protein
LAGFDQRARQHAKGCDRRDLAGQVELALGQPRRLAGKAPGQPQSGEPDRQIDQEDRAPSGQRDQRTAEEGARGQRQARACRPHRNRAAARLRIGIGMVEQRQRVRHQDGGRQALHAARRDQDRRVRRQRASKRRRGEQRKTRHENVSRAEAVAERAGREDERRECNRVGADHPLQFRNAAAQRGADRVQRGVDDGDVELHHAIAETHGSQRQGRGKCGFGCNRGCLGPRRPGLQNGVSHGSSPLPGLTRQNRRGCDATLR